MYKIIQYACIKYISMYTAHISISLASILSLCLQYMCVYCISKKYTYPDWLSKISCAEIYQSQG